jgi:hypothetical protein
MYKFINEVFIHLNMKGFSHNFKLKINMCSILRLMEMSFQN